MRAFVFVLAAASLFAQTKNAAENQNRDRGQVPIPDASQRLDRGRVGTQKPLPDKGGEYTGTLVDASCNDRSAENLGTRPSPPNIAPPPSPNEKMGGAEVPEDIEAHHKPEVMARQSDPSCAITGITRAYGLLTDQGRLLNLDEGGNTFVSSALHASPAGRAMLNGTGAALKPRITLRGRIMADRIIVENIVKL